MKSCTLGLAALMLAGVGWAQNVCEAPPQVDKYQYLRRLSFDLRGAAPTMAEYTSLRDSAEVPLAISQAFRDGHLGVMDYYGLRNLQSDTEMRNSIAGTSQGSRIDNRG